MTSERELSIEREDRPRTGRQFAMRSFSEPDTEFILEKGNNGKPTGVVICAHCGAGHMTVEEIPHDNDCDQRGVVSHWWERTFAAD